jgi:hypothetical protein
MKTNRKHELIAQIAHASFAAAALLVLVLSAAGISRAQSPAPKPATISAAPAASQSAPKGHHEGITIYGQWVIEVKNPDGKVVEHREFDNSLVGPNGVYGSNVLAGLISGFWTVGPWIINFDGTVSPCSTAPNPGGGCTIVSPNATTVVSGYPCSTSVATASPQPNCYATLVGSLSGTEAVAGYGTVSPSFTLSGTAYVDTSTSISNVSTLQEYCNPNLGNNASTTAPSACLATNRGDTAVYAFTSATLGTPVPVSPGQTVDVTVTFSFMSPS